MAAQAQKIDPYSYRVGVVVDLQVRLFSLPSESDVPQNGPAAVQAGSPTLTVHEGGDEGRMARRVWTVAPPRTGGSASAQQVSPATTTTGREPKPAPALVGSAGDETLAISGLIPIRVKWRNNAHRVADELEIELPLAAFPFPADGSIVRSVLVEMRRGIIACDDWADAMAAGAGGGLPDIPVSATDGPDFVGFVDVHKIKIGGGNASTVTLPCRDIAGVLADTVGRGRAIRTDIPADEAVAIFLSAFPACVGLSVVWMGGYEPPTVGKAMPQAKKKKESSKAVSGPGKPDKSSALDLVCDYCTLCGVTPSFVGYEFRMAQARTLDTDFASRVPRMVAGVNLDDLEFEHALTKGQTRAVEARSFNVDSGEMVIARYPPDSRRLGAYPSGQTYVAPPTGPLEVPPGSGGIDERPPEVVTLQNVIDPAQLGLIARNIFEEKARQETTARIKTKDVSTVEGRANGEADLLLLRAGDPLQIVVAPALEEASGSYLQRLASMPVGDAVQALVKLGYDRGVAARVVDGILSVDRPRIMRVREISMTWAWNAATEFEISCVNYIDTLEQIIHNEKPGGNRAKLARNAGYEDQFKAIDADAAAGEMTPTQALDAQAELARQQVR